MVEHVSLGRLFVDAWRRLRGGWWVALAAGAASAASQGLDWVPWPHTALARAIDVAQLVIGSAISAFVIVRFAEVGSERRFTVGRRWLTLLLTQLVAGVVLGVASAPAFVMMSFGRSVYVMLILPTIVGAAIALAPTIAVLERSGPIAATVESIRRVVTHRLWGIGLLLLFAELGDVVVERVRPGPWRLLLPVLDYSAMSLAVAAVLLTSTASVGYAVASAPSIPSSDTSR